MRAYDIVCHDILCRRFESFDRHHSLGHHHDILWHAMSYVRYRMSWRTMSYVYDIVGHDIWYRTSHRYISAVGRAYSAYWNHDYKLFCMLCILFCIFCTLVASSNVLTLNCIFDILFDILNIFIYLLFYIFCILDLVTYCYISFIFSYHCVYHSTKKLIHFAY